MSFKEKFIRLSDHLKTLIAEQLASGECPDNEKAEYKLLENYRARAHVIVAGAEEVHDDLSKKSYFHLLSAISYYGLYGYSYSKRLIRKLNPPLSDSISADGQQTPILNEHELTFIFLANQYKTHQRAKAGTGDEFEKILQDFYYPNEKSIQQANFELTKIVYRYIKQKPNPSAFADLLFHLAGYTDVTGEFQASFTYKYNLEKQNFILEFEKCLAPLKLDDFLFYLLEMKRLQLNGEKPESASIFHSLSDLIYFHLSLYKTQDEYDQRFTRAAGKDFMQEIKHAYEQLSDDAGKRKLSDFVHRLQVFDAKFQTFKLETRRHSSYELNMSLSNPESIKEEADALKTIARELFGEFGANSTVHQILTLSMIIIGSAIVLSGIAALLFLTPLSAALAGTAIAGAITTVASVGTTNLLLGGLLAAKAGLFTAVTGGLLFFNKPRTATHQLIELCEGQGVEVYNRRTT